MYFLAASAQLLDAIFSRLVYASMEPTPEERIARARARRLAKEGNQPPQNKDTVAPPPPPHPAKIDSRLDLSSILNGDNRGSLQGADAFQEVRKSLGRVFRKISVATGCLVLVGTGLNDINSQSKGALSYETEDSFMALQLRSIGYLKIGIGMLAGGFALRN
jgi:hypothetical protein